MTYRKQAGAMSLQHHDTRAAIDAGTAYRALATASAWLGEPYDTRADAALETLRTANRALRAARAHVGA